MNLLKTLLSLIINRAGLKQYYLEIGAYLLRKGAGNKIGDPVKRHIGKKSKTFYLANLHYDFANNRINHTLTRKKPDEKAR